MAVHIGPLRAGIIGCGGIAQEGHIPALIAAGVEIGAVCDANDARAHEVGKRFDVTAIHRDPLQLLDQTDLDLVTIGLPNALHAPITIAALEAGKHSRCATRSPAARSARSTWWMCG